MDTTKQKHGEQNKVGAQQKPAEQNKVGAQQKPADAQRGAEQQKSPSQHPGQHKPAEQNKKPATNEYNRSGEGQLDIEQNKEEDIDGTANEGKRDNAGKELPYNKAAEQRKAHDQNKSR